MRLLELSSRDGQIGGQALRSSQVRRHGVGEDLEDAANPSSTGPAVDFRIVAVHVAEGALKPEGFVFEKRESKFRAMVSGPCDRDSEAQLERHVEAGSCGPTPTRKLNTRKVMNREGARLNPREEAIQAGRSSAAKVQNSRGSFAEMNERSDQSYKDRLVGIVEWDVQEDLAQVELTIHEITGGTASACLAPQPCFRDRTLDP